MVTLCGAVFLFEPEKPWSYFHEDARCANLHCGKLKHDSGLPRFVSFWQKFQRRAGTGR